MPLYIPSVEAPVFIGNKRITGGLTVNGQILASVGVVSTFINGLSGGFGNVGLGGTSGGNTFNVYIQDNVGIRVRPNGTYAWSSQATQAEGTPDLFLARDAANVLAQRNTTNPQTYRLYGTFTDVSNLERLSISSAAGGPFTITSEALGTGTVRNIKLDPGIADIQWGKALVALGGGATATMLTVIGGSGPAAAQQNSWLRILDSTGAACWIPVWK